LEAWARAGAAVAAAEGAHADAVELIAAAEASARATSAWGALAAALRASARAEPDRAIERLGAADQLDVDRVRQLSIDLDGLSVADRARTDMSVTCFGDFSLNIGGTRLDLSELKPRVRSLVRLLALYAGRPVHRETLIEALWPGSAPQTGTRNLQVAISAARQLLERAEATCAQIVREGDAYCLALLDGAEADVHSFEQWLAEARLAKGTGDSLSHKIALTRCLDLYRGDLLSVEGPADWVLEPRDRYRILAADAAEALAAAHLEAGEFSEAAEACERGLIIDRYRDRLWRLRAEALEGAGDLVAAARTRQGYVEMLRDLGMVES
jgi:DNA-binding SARP family transcriptional activator